MVAWGRGSVPWRGWATGHGGLEAGISALEGMDHWHLFLMMYISASLLRQHNVAGE